jgi:predicted transcriptional regulator
MLMPIERIDVGMSRSEQRVDTENMSMKDERLAYPSGWLYLCQHESVHFIIDALVQVDPKKEFTRTELAEFAGVSTQSVRRHIDKLAELGVVAETAGGKRFHYNLDSPVGQQIAELNAEITAIGSGRSSPPDSDEEEFSDAT